MPQRWRKCSVEQHGHGYSTLSLQLVVQAEALWLGRQICPRICVYPDGIKTLPLRCWKRIDIIDVSPHGCKVHLGSNTKSQISPGEGKAIFLSSCRASHTAAIAVVVHRPNTSWRRRQMDSRLAKLVIEGLLHCGCRLMRWGTNVSPLGAHSEGSITYLSPTPPIRLRPWPGTVSAPWLQERRNSSESIESFWFSTLFRVKHSSTSFFPFLIPLTRSLSVNIQSQNLTLFFFSFIGLFLAVLGLPCPGKETLTPQFYSFLLVFCFGLGFEEDAENKVSDGGFAHEHLKILLIQHLTAALKATHTHIHTCTHIYFVIHWTNISFFLKIYFYLFIYLFILAAPGVSCSTWDLRWGMWAS